MSRERLPSLAAGWLHAAKLLPGGASSVEALESRILAHGDAPRWLDALHSLPDAIPTVRHITDDVAIGTRGDLSDPEFARLESALMALHPWRKGPFRLFGLHVDTEWRSDWKWQRLAPHLRNIAGALVCDVGCGNGYYGWRLLGAGAQQIIGLDPTIVFSMQHAAIARYMDPGQAASNTLLPLRLEDFPPTPGRFDVVLSMGVIYHQREPMAHLHDLVSRLKPGGQLVIETLILDTADATEQRVLVPGERYARMRNVWQLPSCASLQQWMSEAGLDDVAIVDVTATTTEEQRSTHWMRFESLANALDPADPRQDNRGVPGPHTRHCGRDALSMGIEIERKFLLRSADVVAGTEGKLILQGYLAAGPVTVRVRVAKSSSSSRGNPDRKKPDGKHQAQRVRVRDSHKRRRGDDGAVCGSAHPETPPPHPPRRTCLGDRHLFRCQCPTDAGRGRACRGGRAGGFARLGG